VVVRVMETLLLSFGMDFVVQVSFRVVAHVFVCLLDNYFEYCRSCTLFYIGIMICLSISFLVP